MPALPRLRPACVLLALAGLSCSSPTAPVATPDLQHLELSASPAPSGVLVTISGLVAEGHQVREHEAVRVHLGNSRGDSAEIRLGRLFCDSSPIHLNECRRIHVALGAGRHLSELAELLGRLDAGLVGPGNSFGGTISGAVEVFSGSVSRVLVELRRHPAVERAERAGGGVVGPVDPAPPHFSRYLRSTLPTRPSDPDFPSAILPVRSGDELTVTYVQPDGSRLVAHARVP